MKSKLPGSFYPRNERWYWRVRLPGEQEPVCLAMIPKGQKKATKDRAVAEECARLILRQYRAKDDPKKAQVQKRAMCRTINDLCGIYKEWSKGYYCEKEQSKIDLSLRPLIDLHGALELEDMTPLELIEVQDAMRHSKRLCLNEINRRISIIKRMFKWASKRTLVSSTVFYGLLSVDGLKEGFCKDVVVHPEVQPADLDSVDAIMAFATQVLADMVHVHLLTGMRPDELCQMKPRMIDRQVDPWCYRPERHKNKWRGKKYKREIFLGPQAQAILARYLLRNQDEYLFKPEESERQRLSELREQRKTPLYGKQKNREPKPRKLGPCYNTDSYRKAIDRMLDKAEKANPELNRWFPYQLRHALGDQAREIGGLEAAAAALGHKDIDTSKIYARLRQEKAAEFAKKYG